MKTIMIYAEQNKNRGAFTSVAKRYSYFWEVQAYLSKSFDVVPVDGILPSVTLYAVSKKVTLQEFNCAIFCVRSNNIERSLEYARFLKVCRPEIKVVVYGDLVNLIPKFFQQFDFIDAVVYGGDCEVALASYLRYLRDGDSNLVGLFHKESGKYFPGNSISTDWSFTDLKVAPFTVYNQMVIDKREMTLTVQKGCPYNCAYCLETKMNSVKARTKNPKDILSYCLEHQDKFDTFRLFAPVFTLDKNWAKEFCRQKIDSGASFKWCTTTRYELLDDEELVDLLVRAGCYKISVGVESVGDSGVMIGRRHKLDVLRQVAGYVNKYPRNYDLQQGLTIVGLCMIGVPTQTKEDVISMFSLMEDLKIRIRPTSFSPLEALTFRSDLTVEEITKYDKFTYYQEGINGVSPQEYFRLIFNPHSYREIFNVQDGNPIHNGFRQCDRFMSGNI